MLKKTEKKALHCLENNGFLNLPKRLLDNCLFPYLSSKELVCLARSNLFFKKTVYAHKIDKTMTFEEYIFKKQKLATLRKSYENNRIHLLEHKEDSDMIKYCLALLIATAFSLLLCGLMLGGSSVFVGIIAALAGIGLIISICIAYKKYKKEADAKAIEILETQLMF